MKECVSVLRKANFESWPVGYPLLAPPEQPRMKRMHGLSWSKSITIKCLPVMTALLSNSHKIKCSNSVPSDKSPMLLGVLVTSCYAKYLPSTFVT